MARPFGTKKIETPERLLELFNEYTKDTKSNPFIVTDWVGGIGKEVERKKERPLTMEGFENYCFKTGVIENLKRYFTNPDGAYDDYRDICSRIKETIRQDQIEGGMAGIYNPSITQRLNGLVEKNQIEVKAEQPFFPE